MTKMMKMFHSIALVVVILVSVSIILINKIYYGGVFHVNIVINISVLTLVGLICSRFIKLNKWIQRTLLVISLLSCMILGLIFLLYKPTYTINDSVTKVIESSEISNIHQNEKNYAMEITPTPNILISSGYVLSGILGEKEVDIIFNPITGEYAIIK